MVVEVGETHSLSHCPPGGGGALRPGAGGDEDNYKFGYSQKSGVASTMAKYHTPTDTKQQQKLDYYKKVREKNGGRGSRGPV